MLTITFLSSCQKDDKEPEKTFGVGASFSFTGTQSWPERYQVVLGAFGSDTLHPLQYKVLDTPDESTDITMTLDEVSEKATLIKLYLANTAKQPVYVFYRYILPQPFAGISIPKQSITLVTFSRVQTQVFSSCSICHGGASGSPAAGLYLTAGNSFENLVSHLSANSSKMRVKPGNTGESFLIDVLRKRQTVFTHTASNTIAEEDIALIEEWITMGAWND